ncbi:hypothetical protein [Cyanobium sp. CH-040]|uniref:hypothetical protein n=1 Tax=Cyanobium sp. CH-040 TaxID=2823708 RepID=UPI0020CCCDB5|nr:hypothetical protein [Cyanobium sp. CH-040]MCP9926767.1 hypothetical protein [Cyanobium sp. CH-040]
MVGLYDSHGVLRYAGRDQADCLAYADLFGLEPAAYSLESLALRLIEPHAQVQSTLAAPIG